VLSLSVKAGPEAARRARKALDRELKGRLSPIEIDELRLLVTETVSNGVRHGGAGPEDQIGIRVEVGQDRIRVEVGDSGPGFDVPDDPRVREDGTGGYGLVLIDRLASRWGVTQQGGTRVWFELARQPHGEGATAASSTGAAGSLGSRFARTTGIERGTAHRLSPETA
jgi:anti-sigma regulatory factor (Ser/Thr protein kinase)